FRSKPVFLDNLMRALFFLLSAFFSGTSGIPGRTYEGHSLLRATPEDPDQLGFLRDFRASRPTMDFWTEPSAVGRPVDIRAAPDEKFPVEEELRRNGLHVRTIISDIQSLIDEEEWTSSATGRMAWDDYQDLATIYEWVDSLALQHPETVTVESIGTTFQGREVKMARFNRRSGLNKTAAFVDASQLIQSPVIASRSAKDAPRADAVSGWTFACLTSTVRLLLACADIHAREWITSATLTYVMNEILAMPEVLDLYDLHFVPVFNPDGFVYTHTTVRSACNPHKVMMLEGGSSNDSCSETYHGPYAFSESETQAVAQYLESMMDEVDWKLYLTIHSYGQVILIPWGWTDVPPDNYDDLMEVSLATIEAIEEVNGTIFEISELGSPGQELTGNTMDWAKGEVGIPFALSFELRDNGETGFLLPPEQIRPSGEEILAGFLAMLEGVRNKTVAF
ncbi:unnamed protein product, partial [Darwinula stevensoni]